MLEVNYEMIKQLFIDNQYALKCLDEFIIAKNKYMKTLNIEDRIDLKMKFVDIYEEVKCAYYCHMYSEEVFLSIKEFLQTIE